ncbi:SDR family NAD(P)-dependent oxidoreductase [Sphingomonas sp. PAMC 26621]|uniref:SDR family NAD(P)-dependent oxidoreductase n=1 Tax=Sphingomonas sp. PAMC 26621 TaxID=1112213 RepID=UPI0009D97BA5|nr:SDR family NAD(P)-dependent oxidoreductase [Sphingomonas sp. PAMC 26621]
MNTTAAPATEDGQGASPKLALITGPSSGTGREFARLLAREGYKLIIVARREDRLAGLAAEFPDMAIRPVIADHSTYAGVAAVADLCASEPLTLLVNNAGVAHYMSFAQLPADKASELLHVKVIAPTMLGTGERMFENVR